MFCGNSMTDEESGEHVCGVRQSAKITFNDDYLFGHKGHTKRPGVHLEERVIEGQHSNNQEKIEGEF